MIHQNQQYLFYQDKTNDKVIVSLIYQTKLTQGLIILYNK
jgi:hypothetical protein